MIPGMFSTPLLRPASLLLITLSLTAAGLAAGPDVPPGHNVHLIREENQSRFWRGGAPRQDTVQALVASARARGKVVTFVDLRKPANSDDKSGKTGRLAPSAEEATAKKLGQRYVAISALDRKLPQVLADALKSGDIYMHCMYGVNRTGFAVARYARASGLKIDRKGLGKRDWTQGDAFQSRLQKQ